MKTRVSFIGVIVIVFIYTFSTGCKKEAYVEPWVETKDVGILAYKSDPENGKQYLEVIYENNGHDSYRKLKYQLLMRTGNKIDTVEKMITPETIFGPKQRHLVPRAIGETPATFDEVKVGKIWAVPEGK
ncbi:MAG: hypothetical protein WCH46_04840 [bacterium]